MHPRSTLAEGTGKKMAIGQAWPRLGKSKRVERPTLWVWRFAAVGDVRDTRAGLDRQFGDVSSPAAFEAFLQGRERDVFGYLWRLTGDEQTAYDLCQETFIRAWQHFAKVKTYDNPGAWLFRVATNLVLNHRQRRAPPTRPTTELGEDEDPASEDL